MRHLVLIVLDSVGIGALPDAPDYGDDGANTLGNLARVVGGLRLPHLQQLGLGNLTEIVGVPPKLDTLGAYGRLAEVSAGKDTTIGHWELAGLISLRPLPTYPQGFPAKLIAEYERRIGRQVLGNKPASGTAIIEELGRRAPAHTAAPSSIPPPYSVFQIAAHEEVIPIEELYRLCQIARELLQGEHNVGRVIARPFIGAPGHFARTDRRRDFSAPPSPARRSWIIWSAPGALSGLWARSRISLLGVASAPPSTPTTTRTAWIKRCFICARPNVG